jgi:hypothetical protein
VHGSLDSLNEDTEPITRRSTMESKSSAISKVAEHEWMKTEHLGVVTGMPTRDHWKVSNAASFSRIGFLFFSHPFFSCHQTPSLYI